MKILLISSYTKSLIAFRGDLIRSLKQAGHKIYAIGPETGFEKQLYTLGATYIHVSFRRNAQNLLGDFFLFLTLIKIVYKIKPDVVLSYTIKPVIYGSLAATMCRVPKICSIITGLGSAFNGNGFKNHLRLQLIQFLYKHALTSAEILFFQNRDDLNVFTSKSLLSKHTKAVIVNGSGVNLQQFHYVRPRTDPLSFLLMARLLWEKGISEYVEAARILKSRYSSISFYLLGMFDSNPSAVKKHDVNVWHKEGIINYLGYTENVQAVLAACGIFVLPSFYREGLPRSILEAMSTGRSIITTDTPGCRETVRDGYNGFIIPPRNVPSLVQAMESFVTNRKLVIEMGKNSRCFAETYFDVHKVNEKMITHMKLGVA